MEIIIGSLLAGLATGWFVRVPSVLGSRLGHIATVTLFVMLAALGAQIGSDKDLLGKLGSLGLHALVLCLFSVAGSVGCLWLIVKKFHLSRHLGGGGQ